MVVLRGGKTTAGAEEEEVSSGQQEGTASCGDQMEDSVAGLEAQLNEVRAMLQTLVGRSVQNIPVAPESAPMRVVGPEFQQATTVEVQSVRGIAINSRARQYLVRVKTREGASGYVGARRRRGHSVATAPIYGGNQCSMGQHATRSED